MFICGIIKTNSLHLHTIFNKNWTHCKHFSHDNSIKQNSQCDVDFSFLYIGQYKIDYILYNVKK